MSADMTTDRVGPPLTAGEREMLRGFLDYHRATLAVKCDGLSDEDLRRRSMPPSTLSLLGLVRHMAEVERSWFRRRVAAQDAPRIYSDDTRPDADFDDVDAADPPADLATYSAEVEAARAAVAGRSLDDTLVGRREGSELTLDLRWVYLHMIEEYARHNGHADLLRERIDGRTGP